MTVEQLIRKLKKMPQHLDVGVAAHDNGEYEVAGWTGTVNHVRKADARDGDIFGREEKDMFSNMPDEWVVLRC